MRRLALILSLALEGLFLSGKADEVPKFDDRAAPEAEYVCSIYLTTYLTTVGTGNATSPGGTNDDD